MHKAASLLLRLAKGLYKLLTSPRPISLVVERIRELVFLVSIPGFTRKKTGRQDILAVGFEYEKRTIMRGLFPEYNPVFLPHWLSFAGQKKLVRQNSHFEALVWSLRDQHLEKVDEWGAKKKLRFEDGFVRSQGLGVAHALPHSFTRDSVGLHFDATSASELEEILDQSDLSGRVEDLERARRLISFMTAQAVSKYSSGNGCIFPLPQDAVLVLGQVEDDASIRANPEGFQTNVELLQEALAKHDASKVYYRPHPDVTAGARPARSNPENLIDTAQLISTGFAVSSLLQQARYVYTISSLGGFEGLMRGAEVYTFGGPFYAGWGLTRDWLQFPRRNRKLSIEQIFLCAYIDYPLYFKPATGRRTSLEATLESLTGKVLS